MPLPTGTYALHGHSRPGDPVQLKPKHAFIVRLSSETLNALDAFPNNPELNFQFGDNPGFFVGESFFPVHQQKEEICHDLYLRSATANRPNVPLKLYANVTGKLTVSERMLDKDLEDRIRKRTADAASQRSVARTKFIDSPAELSAPSGGKKKKEPSMFRKPINSKAPEPSKISRPGQSNTLPPRPQPALPSSSQSSQRSSSNGSLRSRLIHYLAGGERTSDETTRAVAPDCGPELKMEILQLLEQVAEQIPTKNSSKRLWRLKSKTWVDIRPYEWPKLSEADRTRMAREARMALKSLNIPESDPAWDHVKYRATGSTPTDKPTTQRPSSPAPRPSLSTHEPAPTLAPKKGVSSKDAKEKKARVKNEPKEIMMKDESKPRVLEKPATVEKTSKNVSQPSGTSAKAPAAANSRLSPSLTVARKPGSGFRLSKPTDRAPKLDTARSRSPFPPTGVSGVTDNVRLSEAKTTKTTTSTSSVSRQAGTNSRDSDVSMRDETRQARDSMGEPKVKREAHEDRYASQTHRVKQLKEDERSEARWKEKTEKGRVQDMARNDGSSLKRKKDIYEEDRDYREGSSTSKTSGQKKRKTLDDRDRPSLPSSSSKERQVSKPIVKESQAPRLSDMDARKAMKKELSPLHAAPLPKIKKGSSPAPPIAASSSTTSSSSSSSKLGKAKASRRRDNIYTSSEDEGEITSSNPRSTPLPLPTPPTAPLPERPSHTRSGISQSQSKALPKDPAGLRARYTHEYRQYLKTFQAALDERSKIERLLENFPDGSDGSLTDDGGLDLMDKEGLSKIVGDNKKLRQELQNIQQAYESLG
ncbi:hypothetical protein K435DRAFT_788017 [Dendrothele bispora CBS 962.96]|uniref:RNA polymerase II elongation factor ELL N-terminal domain-containing protein n=1 Tax=Dendrothele bispora (strain CBS 962.96) TaxID=1314807 RepID=A0A4S8N131_DENBC|nr:hypothetical protein K435DRAFT_788017 [Dendrothele bispora CBS 962.96]